MVFGIPARYRGIVSLVQQEPLLSLARRAAADEDESPAQLLTFQVEVELTRGDFIERVSATCE
jgi:hypothetical protein